MAFFDGTGRHPPGWFIKRQLGRQWDMKPWEVGNAPAIWAIREIRIMALEAESIAPKNR